MGLVTTRARLRACAVLYPRPAARIHAHMPSARPQPASPCHSPGIEALSLVERSSSPAACAASSSRLFLLPQPWAACLMVRAHGRAMRVDQRRIYVHGLRERAGYVTSLGTKPRRGCPRTHANSACSSSCPKKRSARGGPQRLIHNQTKSPAKSERNPCTCVRRWPARLGGPSPFASK